MSKELCHIGIVGLGTMGSNLALNIAQNGFSIAVYNRTPESTKLLMSNESFRGKLTPCYSLEEMVRSLRKPRTIVLMIKAGDPIDELIGLLKAELEIGDILVDGGNSHFKDTDRRIEELKEQGIIYLGVGISGGEYGARFGPSIMAGGSFAGYKEICPILEKIAAQVEGQSCAAYVGNDSAGHYVKMVHNAIEYGLMQLIAETYDLMNRGLSLEVSELRNIYNTWNQTELNSYLIEITADIFDTQDDKSEDYLINKILDKATQKGTGMWNSVETMTLQVPVPTLDIAVTMRNLSASKEERVVASEVYATIEATGHIVADGFIESLRNALYAGMIITFAQGMSQLHHASIVYGYALKLEEVARIWRGGCIIRAKLLDQITLAFQSQPDLSNLLLDHTMSKVVTYKQGDLRKVISSAVEAGIPVAGFSSCLAYFDAYRSVQLPANLTQAQRDYFGAHSYERVDREGHFHTQWKGK